MDAKKSKTNQDHRTSAFDISLYNVAFYTIARLWHFDVFYSANDRWKSYYYPDSIKKSKQQSTFSTVNFYRDFRNLLQLKKPLLTLCRQIQNI